jgi:para-nitrobenzyl esterase
MRARETERSRRPAGAWLAVGLLVGLCLPAVSLTLVGRSGNASPGPSSSPAASSSATRVPPKLTLPVAVDGGQVVGLREGALRIFRGIPYAAPPVGGLRWRPPQPVASWTGVKQCLAYGASCPQDVAVEDSESLVETQSEDCLFLNVWTPAKSAEERLPVMVWIHGGGFISGSGSLPPMYGRRFSGTENVVLVSVNYRLGVFGFFALPELSAESPQGVSGNYGLLDQNAALQWVRRNIAAFGGDPRRVTIFGQSAGGQSVIAHLVSPLNRGLFARAISESARYQDHGVGIWSTVSLAEQELEGSALCKTLGVAPGPRTLASLRKIPADILVTATAPAPSPLPLLFVQPPQPSFQPVVDGYVLPDEPWRLLSQGAWARVPLLIGSNQDECAMWTSSVKPQAADAVATAARRRVSWYAGPDWPVLDAQFPVADNGGLLPATSRLMTALEFNAPARYTARTVATQGVPAYLYYFSRVPPGKGQSAHHSAEIPYVFDSLNPAKAVGQPESADLALASRMADYWATFAATGDPNAPGQPRWPRYDPAADVLLRLDAPATAAKAPYVVACSLAEQANRRH